MMLRDSNDPEIRSNPPEIRTARKWKAEDEVDSAISILKHRDLVGSVQTDRKGIGSEPFKPYAAMSCKERRAAVSSTTKAGEAERKEVI